VVVIRPCTSSARARRGVHQVYIKVTVGKRGRAHKKNLAAKKKSARPGQTPMGLKNGIKSYTESESNRHSKGEQLRLLQPGRTIGGKVASS